MIAKLAYLTSPAPDRFLLHIQPEGCLETIPFEITKAHLANILIDGLSWSLRETSINRVPNPQTSQEVAHEAS